MSDPAPAPLEVVARAPGKINLFLAVGEVQDDGYHEIATAFHAVSLFEEVRACHAPDFSVTFTGTIDTADLPTDGSNLALRAATLLARRADYRQGVTLEITKNVPIAGGMGGGSADAAATLVACDSLWGTGLSRDDLMALAAELGADVPFAMLGGTALGSGRGDVLSPALAQGRFHWVLVVSDFGLSTPMVYRELDRRRASAAPDIAPADGVPHVEDAVLRALRAGDPHQLAACLHNDLQAAALRLEPRLAGVLEAGEKRGALAGIVSGSGPTVAFLAADEEAAIDLQVALSASGHLVLRATGPVPGARLVLG